jgi:CelD/BcsL family acetyltransferase involved in cellulose biosynthesis
MYLKSFNVKTVLARELTDEYYAVWREIQLSNPALSSPYFCPEFTTLTASVRTNVYVGILKDNKRIIGFFPFYLSSGGHARPIAGPMTDYQGLIIDPTVDFDPKDLLQQCGLQSWEFDHLIAAERVFASYHAISAESPVIDLSEGYDTYFKQKCQSSSLFKNLERKRRKIAREVGPLRYESNIKDIQILHQLLNWKTQQYLRTGLVDLFKFSWTKELLEKILTTQSKYFSGRLSVLYVGDEIAAAHMGMCSHSVWHYWFPSYNHTFNQYSPGLLLLLDMVKDASSMKMQMLDLGKGKDGYKPNFSNAAIPLAEGRVALPSPQETVRQISQHIGNAANRAKGRILSTPLGTLARSTPLGFLAKVPYQSIQRHFTSKKLQ